MKTTVIIPNYNGIDFLTPCLDSLIKAYEASGAFKIIVVDNGSKDGSVDLVKKYCAHDFISLIELKENTGFSYAVNRGIEASDTEYVILLNNDIVVDERFVSELENAISSDERLFSVNSLMRQMKDPTLIDGFGDHYCALGWAFAAYKGKPSKRFEAQKGLRSIFSSCGGASIYRKAVFDKIGLFDEEHFAYLEDVDVGYRAVLHGYKNAACALAVCDHAGSGFSGSRYNEFKIDLASRNSIYIIYKNMPVFQIIINLPFLFIGFFIKTLFFILKGHGSVYLKGLIKGFKLSASDKARAHKVRLGIKGFGRYVYVELILILNIFKRFIV
ncbi:MAG: glycosyltransferase family 2 protein [Lachnospiraceae bacterium]|nr:glycosyltransferase family 2 protein [Lachnospiraceae bacterium]